MEYVARCQLPECDGWSRRCEDGDAADRVLVEHLAQEHPPHRLAEALLGTWLGKDRDGTISRTRPPLDAALVAATCEPALPRAQALPLYRHRPRTLGGNGLPFGCRRRADGKRTVPIVILETLVAAPARELRTAALARAVAAARPDVGRCTFDVSVQNLRKRGAIARTPDGEGWRLVAVSGG